MNYLGEEELPTLYIKLCENTKNYKYAYPGANKFVYGACEQESEEKNEYKKTVVFLAITRSIFESFQFGFQF